MPPFIQKNGSRAPIYNVQIGDRVVMYLVLIFGNYRYVEMGRENLTQERTPMSYQHDRIFRRG